MFHNPLGKLVPHCEDCQRYDPINDDTCPNDALIEVDEYRGVLDCSGFRLQNKLQSKVVSE